MKRLCLICACAFLAGLISCQKQQTEEERKTEIDRQVEQRLAAERQTQEQQKLAEREADVNAREKALSEKQKAAANKPTPRPPSRTSPDSSGSGANYNTFYTKLEPYGDWRETSDYGYVWQPREAERSRGWHPYTQGRWVYTDVGWTWVSEEPFGWATYHYGRWTRLRNVGWVWVPGDEWAPAWVSWRKSDEYVGWAPLPPEARFDRRRGIQNWSDNYYDVGPDQYRFVSTREFGNRQMERMVVPRERNVAIINQTTNVTNITYNNTTVVNQGPNYEEMRTRSQQPIERLRLEREVNVDLNVEVGRPVVRGQVIAIPAPMITIGRPVERPRTVKAAMAQTIVEHGWEDVGDRQAAEQARTKMKSESTPPPDAPSKTFVKPTMVAAQATAAPPVESASPTATATSSPPRAQRTETPAGSATVPSTAPALQTHSVPPKMTQTPQSSATPIQSASPERKARPFATSTPSPSVSASASPATKTTTANVPPADSSPSITPVIEIEPAPSSANSMSPAASPDSAALQRRKALSSGVTSPRSSPQKPQDNTGEQSKKGRRYESGARKFDPNKVIPMPGSDESAAASGSKATASPGGAPTASAPAKATATTSPTATATPAPTSSASPP